MDDITICRRIAEIEGIKTHEYKGAVVPHYKFNDAVNDCKDNVYGYSIDDYSFNPLTDDALCFRLMVKHKASIFYEYGYAAIVCEDKGEFVGSADLYKEPNKAICLAIIEAHK